MSIDSKRKINTFKTVRSKDITIRYTKDSLEDVLINQRQYFDNNGVSLTPITSLLLDREVMGANSPAIGRVGSIEPRYVSVCFGSLNIAGESFFKVVVPYPPGDVNQVEQIKEIQYLSPPPLIIRYHGENKR